MGLDMSIYRKVKENTKEELLNKLEGKEEYIQVAYWRKFWELQDAIVDILGENIENCKEYELDEDNIKSIIDWLEQNKDNKDINEWSLSDIPNDIKHLNRLIAETDFDVYKLIYSGWW